MGRGGTLASATGGGGGGGGFANELSLNFDGNDSLDLGTPFQSTFTSAFSISLWYKQDSATGTQALFGSRKGGDDVVSANITSSAVTMWYESNNIRTRGSIAQTSDTNWHHFCATVQQNGTSVNARIYLDGVYRILIDAGGVMADYTNTANLLIGATSYHATYPPDTYFRGLIDEVAIFSTALSDGGISIDADAGGLIADIYNDGVPTTMPTDDLVSFYRMGDGTGDTESSGGAPANGDSIGTIVDQAGSNNGTQGTAANRPTFSSTVPS
tara:strand:- start:557 stop:1366 length:810 start_codon:yes stop_codon:yes gene_type:complete